MHRFQPPWEPSLPTLLEEKVQPQAEEDERKVVELHARHLSPILASDREMLERARERAAAQRAEQSRSVLAEKLGQSESESGEPTSAPTS